MILHVINRFSPQVSNRLAISANRNLDAYEKFQLPVLTDATTNYDGPLAGIQAGLRWCNTEYLAVAPCDSPLLPINLVAQLLASNERNNTEIAAATNGGRRQPVFALIKSSLADSLDSFLAEGNRKIGQWYDSERLSWVEFDEQHAFSNVNTREDLNTVDALVS